MAYEPTNWKTGDVVTSAKLNKLENAVAQSGGVYIVHDVDGTLDKTFNEIASAAENNAIMIVANDNGTNYSFVNNISINEPFEFKIKVNSNGITIIYTAISRESYPKTEGGGSIT